jgi:hypothetical protein
MHFTLCALVALSVSGAVATEDVYEDEGNWSEETDHQLILGFVNEGVGDDGFLDLSYQSERDDNNSEIFLERLMNGMDYQENTYFEHDFILRSGDFSVRVRVEENEDVDDEEGPGAGFPYSITFDNLAESEEVTSFRIDQDDEFVVGGESASHFTRAEWKHTIYGPSHTPIASVEIFPNSHDEL